MWQRKQKANQASEEKKKKKEKSFKKKHAVKESCYIGNTDCCPETACISTSTSNTLQVQASL